VSDAPRYVPYLRKQGRSYTAEMWEDPSGGWVRADLHDARIAELEAEVARLRDAYLRRVQIDEGCRLKDGSFHVQMRPVDYDICDNPNARCKCREIVKTALAQDRGK
jgi:hypothetical protein